MARTAERERSSFALWYPSEPTRAQPAAYLSIDGLRPKQTALQLLELKRLAELGVLRPVIDRTYPLTQIVEAHRYVEEGHKRGNVISTVGQASAKEAGVLSKPDEPTTQTPERGLQSP